MNEQRNGCDGESQEGRIPLDIDVNHQQEHYSRREDKIWPSQRDSIHNDNLWMDVLFDDSMPGWSQGQNGVSDDKQVVDRNGCSTNYTSYSINNKKAASPPNQAADLTNTHGNNHRRRVTIDKATHLSEEPFRTKYFNAMFSAYSVKGWWVADDTNSSLPCHHIHLIKEPALLTLSSFPFRIIYANDILLQRLRRTSTDIMGVSFFDYFASDDLVMQPCLARYDLLVGLLLNGIGCSMRIGHETSKMMPCFVKGHPVF